MTANSIIVMAKADVELQRQREQDDWRKRGTTGIVTVVDSVANTFTIKVEQTIRPESNADFRRYALDSVSSVMRSQALWPRSRPAIRSDQFDQC
jgi:hypothetical protein